MSLRRALLVIALIAALPASAQTTKILGIRVAAPFCGDGHIDAGEQCDGTSLGSNSCSSFSCSTGAGCCNASCVYVATFAGCASPCGTCSTGDLLDEAFTAAAGTGSSDGTTLGFDDASWTRTGDANSADTPVPNPNATSSDGCPTTTGWGGECLKMTINPNLAAFHDIAEKNAFTATSTGVWVRVRTKQNFTLNTDGNTLGVAALGTTSGPGAVGSIRLEIDRTTGPTYTLLAIAQGVASNQIVGSGYAITTGASICLEFYLNSTTNTAQWWVDGVDKGILVDATNLVVVPTTLWLGPFTPPSSADTAVQWWDQAQVSSTGRLACN
jgi:hypothetical protein